MAQSAATVTRSRAKAYAPITMRAGEDITISLNIDETDGTAEDLSGDDLEWTMKRRGSKYLAMDKKTIGDGITVVSEAGGTATIAVDSADTKNLEPGFYDHELWLKESDDDYEPLFKGLIHLLPSGNFGSTADTFETS